MYAKADDNRVAWRAAQLFLKDENETYLMLQMEGGYSSQGYTIVKLPYGQHISLLYAKSWYDGPVCPGIDLKYAGFLDRRTTLTYDIREPLTRFFDFDRETIYEGTLKSRLISGIQRTVAEYIAEHAEEFSGFSAESLAKQAVFEAERAFSKQEAVLSFANRIEISDWGLSNRNLVDFIDDPDTLLKRKAEERVKDHEEELARLWVAHCAAARILEGLYAELPL